MNPDFDDGNHTQRNVPTITEWQNSEEYDAEEMTEEGKLEEWFNFKCRDWLGFNKKEKVEKS